MLGKQNLLNSNYKELSELVPANHLLKKISKLVDFSFIYPVVKKLYANNFGRPSVDPVLFFKMQLIGYVFGIKSDRQLCKEIQLNIAYRWFCKLGINDIVPEHSSLTKTRDRFGLKIYRKIFESLIKKSDKIGIISGKVMISDASLIIANASLDSMNPRENLDPNCRNLKTYEQRYHDFKMGKKKEKFLIKLT